MFAPVSKSLPWILAVACIPAYLVLLDASLWTDEAWVAGSTLAPSVGQMLFYDDWVQSTPPLVLLGMRMSVSIFGASELAFRLPALIGGIAALLLMGLLLRQIFPLPLALLGMTFQGLNYWAVKYSQQSKQYATDLFASVIFLLLLQRSDESAYSRSRYWTLLAFGTVAAFLSHPAVFWYPSAILALASDGHQQRKRRASTAVVLWATSAAVN